VALCVQPGSGDSMQFMKAGIMEIPHIAAVTKADAGPAASRALAELKGALGLAAPADPEWETPCLAVSATTGHGVAELAAQAERHFAWLGATGRLAGQRRAQAESWLRRAIALEFGRRGVAALGDGLRLAEDESPFAKEAELTRRLAGG
jgi:LAO/AO transport system kinase